MFYPDPSGLYRLKIQQLKWSKQKMSNKEQELQNTIDHLKLSLEKAQKDLDNMKKPKKWEPKGDWCVLSDGSPGPRTRTAPLRSPFGNAFPTREAAEEAAKSMRVHNRLLAYVAEFAPGFKQPPLKAPLKEDVASVYYSQVDRKYISAVSTMSCRSGTPNVIFMPIDVAFELADKLNSGEVEL